MSTLGKGTATLARDYNAAIKALNTLQSNFAIVDAIRKSGRRMNENAMPEMIEWTKRIGYEPSDFNALKVIHVAGTKGKGSTSAFISSILCQYLQPANQETPTSSVLRKIGLYTSPHLRSVRERIQINQEPLSEASFAKYFFEVWDRLEASEMKHGPPSFVQMPDSPDAPRPLTKPVYFRYLTLMAFHAYLSEKVDTAIIECGIGGEYDSTNIVLRPTVTAVTSLGIDHTAMLGESIQEIAWHKAGIFKSTSVTGKAYTVASQVPEALTVLQERAQEKNVELCVVHRHRQIDNDEVKIGLAADFQKINASLAVSVAAAYLDSIGVPDISKSSSIDPLPKDFCDGLERVKWGGRCETRLEANIKWHLDGGHTIESIKLASEWFGTSISSSHLSKSNTARKQKRILLFNQQTRDANALARILYSTVREAVPAANDEIEAEGSQSPLFTHAIFSTNVTYAFSTPQTTEHGKTAGYKADLMSINTSSTDVTQLTVQKALAETWLTLDKGCNVRVETNIEDSIRYVRELAAADPDEDVVVLVTGSLHLVGGVLEILETTSPMS